jgi:hypothetical protein
MIDTSPPKNLKRRANILYRLRKKGIICNLRERIIFIPAGENSDDIVQVRRLRSEFGFNIQLIFKI